MVNELIKGKRETEQGNKNRLRSKKAHKGEATKGVYPNMNSAPVGLLARGAWVSEIVKERI